MIQRVYYGQHGQQMTGKAVNKQKQIPRFQIPTKPTCEVKSSEPQNRNKGKTLQSVPGKLELYHHLSSKPKLKQTIGKLTKMSSNNLIKTQADFAVKSLPMHVK